MPSAVETLIRSTVTKGMVKLGDFNRSRLKAQEHSNPYLEGVHRPMSAELSLTDVKVTGEIPAALDGTYVRIGPNPATPQNPAAYHWFTGDGMVHGVRLRAGSAEWYRNRWIRSSAVSAALGEPAAPGPRHNFDTVNTNVIPLANQIWALVEAGGYPVRIDDELATIAHDPFGGTLKGSFTAHPHLDPETGESHAICYEATDPLNIRHVVINPQGKVIREEPIPVQHGPSIHDCMITKNYVIILDLPVTFSMKLLIAGYQFPYHWNPGHHARIGLLPRQGHAADIIWCEISPCYVFHPCNGYETGDGKVILDACVHDSMFDESRQGPDSKLVPFERWEIDPATRKVSRAIIDPDAQEFPRPNEAFIGKPYRYAYTMALPKGFDVANPDQSRLFKHDMHAITREVHEFGAGHMPGEFVFVARPDAKTEDDGWMIGYVVNIQEETTDLIILNADDFSGSPQAIIHIPHRIPPGFHGNWIPSQD